MSTVVNTTETWETSTSCCAIATQAVVQRTAQALWLLAAGRRA
jgi:hypothetical protein